MASTSTADLPEKAPDESSKLKTFLSILRKFVGVSDIASVRFSLPAQLLEPTPNLGRIGTSNEPLGRTLEVLRFWFTKDLKYIKNKPCKPYNSTLGEFFRCSWEVGSTLPELPLPLNGPSANGVSTVKDGNGNTRRVCFLTEQTSHHPPVSAFYIDCAETGVSARGFDQISAKFTGTSIRVAPGQHNLGIFLNISTRDDEEYQLTHPAAHLGGLLRGALSISVADTCFIVCPKTRIKVILQYLEEGWISRAQNKVEGIIFRYDPDQDTITRTKDVPEGDVLARISGSWHNQLYYTLSGVNEPQLLIDIAPLYPAEKSVPPEENQLSNESRKFWSGVTEAILNKKYNQATKLKVEIEERQRQKAAERQAKNEEWKPRFFTGAVTPLGKPALNEEGLKALEGLRKAQYELEESEIKGA
ncbi:hypothetical protein BJY04DRAFT_227045 [Aspergillus karnatakaensis]|uniref:putative oxysterol binding protein (Orp8) n=1 Tax=Aspergillus karnatakaensis TaxID=1810916 RepID=UPI003CCDAC5A